MLGEVKLSPSSPADAWPYFFARVELGEEDWKKETDNPRHTPRIQTIFMKGVSPDNHALLPVWLREAKARFALREDRSAENTLLASWCDDGFVWIRNVLSHHPKVKKLTDLLSMLPLVRKGLTTPNGQVFTLSAWQFYDTMFMPGPNRVAVPLPAGMVIFEGRAGRNTPDSVLNDRVRRVPFSASWHVDAALRFAFRGDISQAEVQIDMLDSRSACLFVHKIMSDGILGVDVQLARYEDDPEELLEQWSECEIIVQPLVSFHLVEEAVAVFDVAANDEQKKHITPTIVQRVMFTHAFLGVKCPCEAEAEAAIEAGHYDVPAASASAKHQRTGGRFKMKPAVQFE